MATATDSSVTREGGFKSPRDDNVELTLIGLHTRYSSWTARIHVLLEYFQIPYRGEFYNIFNPATPQPPEQFKGSFVPLLQPLRKTDPTFVVNDSLAICEYLAEAYADRGLWPQDSKLRALARSAVAQMHSGFSELRNTYHTNYLAKYSGKVPITDEAAKEIKRMLALWSSSRAKTVERLAELGEQDEGFLFGKFSIADAFFWPVLWRFRSYQLPLTGISEEGLKWMKTMWSDPVIKAQGKDYFLQAKDQVTKITKYDDIFKGNPEVEYGLFEEDWEFQP